jgi:hypothetical protein
MDVSRYVMFIMVFNYVVVIKYEREGCCNIATKRVHSLVAKRYRVPPFWEHDRCQNDKAFQ